MKTFFSTVSSFFVIKNYFNFFSKNPGKSSKKSGIYIIEGHCFDEVSLPLRASNTKKMSILTLDLGKQTGWAILTDGVIESGSESFHGSRFSGGGMCFLSFSNWLNSLQDISVVYFEEVRRHLGTDAAHCYGGFFAVLAAWCEENNIPYQGVNVKTIKRFIAGKGNASKSEVIEAIREKGFSPRDDNEADALALMFYVNNFSKDFNMLDNT